MLSIFTDEILLTEIKNTLKALKSGKSFGVDEIIKKILKVDIDTISSRLNLLFNLIMEMNENSRQIEIIHNFWPKIISNIDQYNKTGRRWLGG